LKCVVETLGRRMSMSTFTIVLEDDQGQKSQQSFSTSVTNIEIGRGKSCQVVIDSSGASRKHALLVYENGRFALNDQGTTNGTYVNTRQISGTLLLAPGDIIEISGHFLEIQAPSSVWTKPRPTSWGIPSLRQRQSLQKRPKPPSDKSVNLSDSKGNKFLAVRSVSGDIRVDGPLATMKLVITFHNDLGRTIEGDLVFPLPPMAAMRSLVAKIGSRTITGKVRGRARAQTEYQRAIDAGQSAALGESEGEDLARLKIAPIEAGEDVEITLTVDQILLPISDGHRLIVPLTYMPRYIENASETNETELAAVERPRPLTLQARASVDIHLEHPEGKPATIRCVSHRVTTKPNDKTTLVELRDAPLDRDLHVEIADRPRGEKPAVWVRHDATNGPDDNGPTTTVAIVPPAFADEGPTIARNIVFLVDRSGSMNGAPMAAAIRAVRGALRGLGPEDRFNIIAFDNELEALAIAPVPFDDAALTIADTFISNINARGGTEASKAIQAALAARLDNGVSVAIAQPSPPDQTYRLRVVVFMTDGDVANAATVLRAAKEKLFDTRLHVLGVGGAVHHGMLAELAEVGGGTYTPVATDEDLEKALVRLKNAITSPLWTSVRVLVEREGERKTPKMLEPPGPIDLFAAEPVLFSFRGPVSSGDKLVLVGQKAEGEDQRISLELTVPRDARAEGAATLWALLRNRRLTYRFDPADKDTLEGLGTAFGVVNREVALVGVNSDPRQSAISGSVPVSLPLPNNVDEDDMRMSVLSSPVPKAKLAAPALRSAIAMPAPAPARSPMGSVSAPRPPGAPPPPAPPGFGGAPPPPPPGFGGAPPPPPGFAPIPPQSPKAFGPPPAFGAPGFGPPPSPGAPPPPPGFGPPPVPMSPAAFGPPPAPAAMYGAPPPPPGASRRAPPPPAASPAPLSITFTDDDAGLRALLLNQKADGLFGGDIAATLAAVAALVGRGHTAREGLFRAELRRTMQTLRGKIASLSGNEQILARVALAMLVMPHGDPAPDGLAPEIAASLDGLSLADLTTARAKVRAALGLAPAGWDGGMLAGAVKRAFL
jgi:Ca-activated chloride channel homolog